MTARREGNIDNKRYNETNENMYYDVNYYGDDSFLKTSSYEKEKNAFESRISELEWRNKALEGKIKTLIVSVIVFLLILFIGTLIIVILHELNIEQNYEKISELQRVEIHVR